MWLDDNRQISGCVIVGQAWISFPQQPIPGGFVLFVLFRPPPPPPPHNHHLQPDVTLTNDINNSFYIYLLIN